MSSSGPCGFGRFHAEWMSLPRRFLRSVPRSVISSLCVPKASSTSCDQVIFVYQATDVSLPSDVVLVEIDRLGQRFQRRGCVWRAVRAVLIMVGFVLAQNPPQMGLVPDESAVQELAGLLGGPFPCGMHGDSEDADAPGGVLDHGQDVGLEPSSRSAVKKSHARIMSA
jgi:hypothetical protein